TTAPTIVPVTMRPTDMRLARTYPAAAKANTQRATRIFMANPSAKKWKRQDVLLNRAADGRENVISVRSDQPHRPDHEHKDYGQHHGVFSDVLTSIICKEG